MIALLPHQVLPQVLQVRLASINEQKHGVTERQEKKKNRQFFIHLFIWSVILTFTHYLEDTGRKMNVRRLEDVHFFTP